MASSSIEAAAGDDSLSVSVLSLSTLTAGSGADSINLAKAVSSEVYTNQGNDFITASGDATTTQLLLVVKELIPSVVGGDVTGGRVLGNSGADSITIAGTVNSALVHGGADNDSMTLGAVVGGTVGGGLGADTLDCQRQGDWCRSADVQLKSDPNSTSDKADSLSVAGSMSNSTIYAGAGDDNISVDSHLIAGEFFAGSGADTVMVGGSLGGTIEMSDGADSLTAEDARKRCICSGWN